METSFHSAVSQYAKTDFPTSKPNATKDFEVRQQDKNSLHTPTHPRKDNGAGTGENFLTEKIDLKKLIDFISVMKALFPKYKVSFTINLHLQNQFTCFSRQHLDLFFNLVQSFTLLHHSNRQTDVENILATNETDYKAAFELWENSLVKKTKTVPVQVTAVDRVLYFLQTRFKDKTFTPLLIAVKLNHSDEFIRKAFEDLQTKNQIQKIENPKDKRESIYKLCA